MTATAPGKRERTRTHVLDTALELFARDGYEATSMGAIASASGVVRQTVLNHFPRKEDLVLAWGDRRRARLASASESVGSPDLDGIRAVYRELAAINEAERDLAVALHAAYEAVARVRVVPEQVLAAVARATEHGDLDPAVPTEVAGELLTAVYFDTLSRWLDAPRRGPLETVMLERVDLVLRGLARQ